MDFFRIPENVDIHIHFHFDKLVIEYLDSAADDARVQKIIDAQAVKLNAASGKIDEAVK